MQEPAGPEQVEATTASELSLPEALRPGPSGPKPADSPLHTSSWDMGLFPAPYPESDPHGPLR